MATIQPVQAAFSTLRTATLERKLLREVAGAGLPLGPGSQELVTDEDLAALPSLVQRYLRFMGVAGRPRDWSFRLHFEGRFLFGGRWVPCRAAQYDMNLSVARIFHMRLPVGGVIPTYVRDTYVHGRGHMLGKAFDTFRVVDDGSDEIATGELVTYLNDCILFAPSMLLVPDVRWAAVDDRSFDVSITDAGRTVMGRVFVTREGVPTDFSTVDRFYADPAKPKERPLPTEWRTPIDGWQSFGGRAFPTHGRAVWMLPAGPLPYVEMDIDPRAVTFNVAPGS